MDGSGAAAQPLLGTLGEMLGTESWGPGPNPMQHRDQRQTLWPWDQPSSRQRSPSWLAGVLNHKPPGPAPHCKQEARAHLTHMSLGQKLPPRGPPGHQGKTKTWCRRQVWTDGAVLRAMVAGSQPGGHLPSPAGGRPGPSYAQRAQLPKGPGPARHSPYKSRGCSQLPK